MKIRSLPSEVVDQIAAGEVVDRPAHMVKELVENSLDSGATLIEVEFDQGGRRVRVTDDGGGIEPEDLPLALARHATSKISEAADLWRLNSFGFRGEALASIAAVSRLMIVSRRRDGDGQASRLLSEFGKVGAAERAGGNPGTTVIIEELFANVPARLKFLKSESAESSQIKNALKALALSHPEVEFRLKSGGKTVQVWPKAKGFRERAEQVLEIKPLFENSIDFGGLKAQAVFASPHQVTGNARQIWLFVQDRWIQDRGLQAAVIDAYRGLLMHGEFPIACVRLSCPPDDIDVNIHPTKSAVKFRDSQSAFRAVHRCLREGLEKAPWIEKKDSTAQSPRAAYSSGAPADRPGARVSAAASSGSNAGSIAAAGLEAAPKPLSFADPELQRTQYQKRDAVASAPTTFDVLRAAAAAPPAYMADVEAREGRQEQAPDSSAPSSSETRSSANSSAENSTAGSPVSDFVRSPSPQAREAVSENARFWSRLQVLGQAHLTYILAENNETLFLIDQHAAHERIAYERLMRAWRDGKVERQDLLLPLAFDLDIEAAEALAQAAPELARLGVELEPMGPGAIAVRSIPIGIKESAIVSSLAELGREIAEKGGGFALERKISDLCATMACHSVVRAGQALGVEQMRSLLAQMDEFPLSSFCPHGRPVSVEYPFTKLERDFGRIV